MRPDQWDALRDWIRAEIQASRVENSAGPHRAEAFRIRHETELRAHEALVIRHDPE